MSLLSDLGTKVGAEFKSHRLRIEDLETDVDVLKNVPPSTSLDSNTEAEFKRLTYNWTSGTVAPIIDLKNATNYGIFYHEGSPDHMYFATSGETSNYALDISETNLKHKGNVVLHSGNYNSYFGMSVTTPYAFNAYSPVGGTTAGNRIVYTSIRFNKGNAYNTSTGKFTAPITGYYAFSFSVLVNTTGPGYTRVYWDINGSSGSTWGDTLEGLGGASWGSAAMSTNVYLNAGDYVSVKNDGNNTYGNSYGHFAGHFIGQ